MLNKSNHIKNSVIICVFNEEKGLPVVLTNLFKYIDETYEVLVVDDGSTDNSLEVASRFQCRIISHEKNLGKGEAIRTGAMHARGENIIFIDADDTYPVETISKIAQDLKMYDMVVGSRLEGRNNIPMLNRLGNFVLSLMIRKLYGFKPCDPLTGLWGIKNFHLKGILPSARYCPDAEVAMKAARMQLHMLDVPISYRPRIGKTKLPPFKAGFEHLKIIFSLLFRDGRDAK
jgi:glycosyltransferase involved in cell wall biosynthesis